ncbi:metal-dependent hydrolase [Halocatena halophila]|uniref:metal-dependent hydrolase n=1 Tax=Halocatena halophila TaxID=2814576 RepID=UPI002ED581F3
MHRRGHIGLTLLGIAPVLYVLLPEKPLLAVLALGVFVIEPLPDYDHRLRWLEHRKTSHSLLMAAFVGGICSGLGWLLGQHITLPLASLLSSLAAHEQAIIAQLADQLALLDPFTMALIGGTIGAGGVLLHLLADAMTVNGIQPFLPFSRIRISFSSLYSDNPIVNVGLLLLGWLAIIVVTVLATPLSDLAAQIGGFLYSTIG